jgi:hypothetical protein
MYECRGRCVFVVLITENSYSIHVSRNLTIKQLIITYTSRYIRVSLWSGPDKFITDSESSVLSLPGMPGPKSEATVDS